MTGQTATDAGFTEFTELEEIRITIPKKGHPAKGTFRGEVTHIARVSAACAEELEAKLERVNADVRHGVPRIYRGDRELAPPRGEDIDDVEAIVPPADATANERREVELHRDHVRLLKDQAALLQRQVDATHRELDQLRTRRDAEFGKVQRILVQAEDHLETSVRRTFALDTLAQEERAKSLMQFASGAKAVREARDVLDGFMLQNTWGDMLSGAKDLVVAALDSDLGKMGAFQVQAILAAKVGKWLDLPDLTPQDALAAMMVTGAKFQTAVQAVTEWAALHAAEPEGQAASVVVAVLRGDAKVEALEDLARGAARRRNSPGV